MKTPFNEYLSWSPFVRLVHDFCLPPDMRNLYAPAIGDHALHYFASGSGVCICKGKEVPIKPGVLFTVRPGESYNMQLTSDSKVRMYNIRFDLDDTLQSVRTYPCPAGEYIFKRELPEDMFPDVIKIKNQTGYTNLFFRLLACRELSTFADELAAKAVMLELLSFIAGEAAAPSVPAKTVGAIITSLLQKYSHHRGLPPAPETLAKEAGMSRSSFYRHFRLYTGRSIHDYFLGKRILHTQMELIHTDLSIKDIAGRYGFSTVQSFTRIFQTRTGTTPAKYRKEYKNLQ